MIISPLTPRRSGCVSRAERPRQSITMPSMFGRRATFAVELDGAAGGDDARVQFRQHAARLDMAFVGKKQRVAEAAVERGFELGKRRAHRAADGPAVSRAKRSKSLRSRGCATTSEPLNGVSGNARATDRASAGRAG